MADAADHEQRSREIADTTRRFVVAVNTGGIGLSFGFAGALAAQKISPDWVVLPVAFFIVGLVATGVSLFLAKHREIKRGDAAKAGEPPPDYRGCWWRSFTWDFLSLVLFVVGCVTALLQLRSIVVAWD